MQINTKDITNETLLTLFKKLNDKGKSHMIGQSYMTSSQFNIYKQVRKELQSRMDKEHLQQWEYLLFPKYMSYSGIDVNFIEEVLCLK